MKLLSHQREGKYADALLAPQSHLHLLRVADTLQDGLHLLPVHADAVVRHQNPAQGPAVMLVLRGHILQNDRYAAFIGAELLNSVRGVLHELLHGFLVAAADMGEDFKDSGAGLERQPGHLAPPYVNCPLSPLRSHQASQARSEQGPWEVRLKWGQETRVGFVLRHLGGTTVTLAPCRDYNPNVKRREGNG